MTEKAKIVPRTYHEASYENDATRPNWKIVSGFALVLDNGFEFDVYPTKEEAREDAKRYFIEIH